MQRHHAGWPYSVKEDLEKHVDALTQAVREETCLELGWDIGVVQLVTQELVVQLVVWPEIRSVWDGADGVDKDSKQLVVQGLLECKVVGNLMVRQEGVIRAGGTHHVRCEEQNTPVPTVAEVVSQRKL